MWVNKDKYSPSKRHYFPIEGVVRHTKEPVDIGNGYSREEFIETTEVNSLCGQTPMSNTGNRNYREGKQVSEWGGLSAVANPNLNQRNLCSYCVKKYVTEVKPELAEAYNILKGKK